MEFAFIIYFINVICQSWQGVGFFLIVFGVISLIIIVMSMFTPDKIQEKETDETLRLFFRKKCWKWIASLCFSILFLSNFIPDRDTAYTMLAAYGVQEVAQMPQVQATASKSLEVLNKAMDQYLKDQKVLEEKKSH